MARPGPKPSSSPAAVAPVGLDFGRWAPAILVVAVMLAYLSSFGGVFVFDDAQAIVENPTLRAGWRLDQILFLPGAEAGTVGGRPVANLTFALNYAISGIEPWSYHAINLVIHLLAVLTAFAVLRRLLGSSRMDATLRVYATGLAFVCALVWGLHPLQTESVTYVVQRVESLTGLLYLLTLYGYIRSVETPRSRAWQVFTVVVCLLGMATKEVMVSAPLFLLLLDRALYAPTWREVWRQRGRFHFGLMSTWLLLAVLVAGTAGRGGSAGFGVEISPWIYLLTQAEAVVHYVRLAFWPAPLVFDYGSSTVSAFSQVWWQFLTLTVGLLATLWAVVRKPLLALPGAWFFLILAPSSSVVPIATQTMAEHRMYLPLLALVVVAALALHRWVGPKALPMLGMVAVGCGWLTAQRNLDYHDEGRLWTQTAKHRPQNFRAHTTLGVICAARGEFAESVSHYEAALRLAPDSAPTHLNLSDALLKLGRVDPAVFHGSEAVRLEPDNMNARINFANALVAAKRVPEAVAQYEVALAREPEAEDIHINLGLALLQQGDAARAVRHFTLAIRLNPDRAATWFSLAQAELKAGNREGAQRAAAESLRRQPDDVETLFLLGNLAASADDLITGIRHFRKAVTLSPGFVAARNNLANALLMTGQVAEAIGHYREILAANPNDRRVQENLAHALELQRTSGRGR